MHFLPLSLLLAGAAAGTRAQLEARARIPAGCWPVTPETGVHTPLVPVKTAKSANGYYAAPRGWNSWGTQINPRTTPSAPRAIAPLTNQTFTISQCDVLADTDLLAAGYDLCSIDGGWSSSITDDYGRVTYNASRYNIPELGTHLHTKGLKLGLYNQPNLPCEAGTKKIQGTNILISSIFNGVVDERDNYCYLNYSHPATQLFHDSQIALWASWGVDMIKLDFITPGSITGAMPVPDDTTGSVVAHHKAIVNSGRQIRLDVSSNVCRSEPFMSTWVANADTMRVAVDINNHNTATFVGMWKIQGTIEQYRLYINQLVAGKKLMRARPDFDNMFVGNPASVSGIDDAQRVTVMSHWLGAAGNLILGSDLSNLDDLGRTLLTSSKSGQAVDFCNNWPMQPRNPGNGSSTAQQLQAWVAGPSDSGQAYVLLSNYGVNHGRGGFTTVGTGAQNVTATLQDLGLTRTGYLARDVWSADSFNVGASGFSVSLNEGESRFYRITPA